MHTFVEKDKDFLSVEINESKTVFTLPTGSYYLVLKDVPVLEKQITSEVNIGTDVASLSEKFNKISKILTHKEVLSKRNNVLIHGKPNSGKSLLADLVANASIKEGKVVLRITDSVSADLLRYVLTTIKQPVLVILDNIIKEGNDEFLDLLAILTDHSLENISFLIMAREIPEIGGETGFMRSGRFQFKVNTSELNGVVSQLANYTGFIESFPLKYRKIAMDAINNNKTYEWLNEELSYVPMNWEYTLKKFMSYCEVNIREIHVLLTPEDYEIPVDGYGRKKEEFKVFLKELPLSPTIEDVIRLAKLPKVVLLVKQTDIEKYRVPAIQPKVEYDEDGDEIEQDPIQDTYLIDGTKYIIQKIRISTEKKIVLEIEN